MFYKVSDSRMVRKEFITDLVIPLDNIERVVHCNNYLFVVYANNNNMWEIIVYRIKKHVIQCVVNIISSGINATNIICNFLVNDCRAEQGDNSYTPTYKILVEFNNTIKLFTLLPVLTDSIPTTCKILDIVFYNAAYYILTHSDGKLDIQQYNIDSSCSTIYTISDYLLPHKTALTVDGWRLVITNSKVMLFIQDRRQSIIIHVANICDRLEFIPINTYSLKQTFDYIFDRIMTNDKFLIMYNKYSMILNLYNTNLMLLDRDKRDLKDICLQSDNTVTILSSKYGDETYVKFYRIV